MILAAGDGTRMNSRTPKVLPAICGQPMMSLAIRTARDAGLERSLVGFVMTGRGIARQGHPIMSGPDRIGVVTSGSVSPTLDMNIGMGYVPTGFSDTGTRLQIDVRGRMIEAEVKPLPFYSRRKSE